MSIFLGPSDANADSLGFIYCVLSNLNGVAHHAHLPIFCLSVIFTAMNKAVHQYNLSLCHSDSEKRLHVTFQVELERNSSVSFDFSV